MKALLLLICVGMISACAGEADATAGARPQGSTPAASKVVDMSGAVSVCTKRWTGQAAMFRALSRSGFNEVSASAVAKDRLVTASTISQNPLMFIGKDKKNELSDTYKKTRPDGTETPSVLYDKDKNKFVKEVTYAPWFGENAEGAFLLVHYRYVQTHTMKFNRAHCVFLSPQPSIDRESREIINRFQKAAKFTRTAKKPFGQTKYTVTDVDVTKSVKGKETEVGTIELFPARSSRLIKAWQPGAYSLFISSLTYDRYNVKK